MEVGGPESTTLGWQQVRCEELPRAVQTQCARRFQSQLVGSGAASGFNRLHPNSSTCGASLGWGSVLHL